MLTDEETKVCDQFFTLLTKGKISGSIRVDPVPSFNADGHARLSVTCLFKPANHNTAKQYRAHLMFDQAGYDAIQDALKAWNAAANPGTDHNRHRQAARNPRRRTSGKA